MDSNATKNLAMSAGDEAPSLLGKHGVDYKELHAVRCNRCFRSGPHFQDYPFRKHNLNPCHGITGYIQEVSLILCLQMPRIFLHISKYNIDSLNTQINLECMKTKFISKVT